MFSCGAVSKIFDTYYKLTYHGNSMFMIVQGQSARTRAETYKIKRLICTTRYCSVVSTAKLLFDNIGCEVSSKTSRVCFELNQAIGASSDLYVQIKQHPEHNYKLRMRSLALCRN